MKGINDLVNSVKESYENFQRDKLEQIFVMCQLVIMKFIEENGYNITSLFTKIMFINVVYKLI